MQTDVQGIEMGGAKRGSLKPIEYGNATVGTVKLEGDQKIKKKEGLSHYELFIASILLTSKKDLKFEN